MRGRVGLVIGVLIILVVASCASPDPYFGKTDPPSSLVLRVGLGAEPVSLDPHTAPGAPEEQIILNLFEGLTEYDPITLEPVAGVAERWEANSRATRFRFFLRPTARWSNGRPVTASDFVYSWRRALAPETASPTASLLYYIKNAEGYNTGKVRIRDRRTGQFLTDPYGGDLLVKPDDLRPERWRIIRELVRATEGIPFEIAERKENGGSVSVTLRHSLSGTVLAQESGEPLVVPAEDVGRLEFYRVLVHRLERTFWEAVAVQAEDVGVRALDDHTLEVETHYPTAFFVKLTMTMPYRPVPVEAVTRWGRDWTRPEHIVTNGPFTLAGWRPGNAVELRRSPTYWDAGHVRLERAIYYTTEDYTTLVNLYKSGEVDALTSGLLPPYAIRMLKTKRDYQTGPYLLSYYLLVNVTRPPLSDRRVRQALDMALDKEQICRRVLGAGQQPLTSLTPSDFGGSYPRPRGPSYDPQRARELMAEAGYPDGRGVRLRYLFNSGLLHTQIAEAVQAQWQDVFPAISVELVNQSWQVYLSSLQLRDYDVAKRSWSADYNDPLSFLETMLSTNANNQSGWANAEYDRLVWQGNTEPDPARRMQLLARAEQILLAEQPIIPIYASVSTLLVKPYVRGWTANLLDRHPLRFVSLESEPRLAGARR